MAPAKGAGRAEAVSLAARRQEKKRARRRVRLLRLAVIGGTLAFLGFIIWVLFFSSAFALSEEDVVIEGAQSGPMDERIDAQVREVVAPLAGSPLLRISLKEVQEDLASSPLILDSKVERQWPTGLRVTTWPREAVFAQATSEGYLLIGADGVVIETVQAQPEGVPMASLSALGDQGAPSQAAIALKVWDSLPAEAQAGTSLIHVEGSQISIDLVSGARVIWGDVTDSPLKGQLLQVLLTDPDVGTYDVSDPTRPSTR